MKLTTLANIIQSSIKNDFTNNLSNLLKVFINNEFNESEKIKGNEIMSN